MSKQRFNNPQKNTDPNFNLDDYINERSTSKDEYSSNQEPIERKSRFFKNTVIIIGFGVISLFYLNNWSPEQFYGNIFGVEKSQTGFEPAQQESNINELLGSLSNDPSIAGLSDLKELQNLGDALQDLEGLEKLDGLENLEQLKTLESSLAGLEYLDEATIRNFALETAMEALNGIQESGEFGTEIQVSIQDAIKELERVRESESIGSEQVVVNTSEINSSLNHYSDELKASKIEMNLSSSDIQKLYDAKVPISTIKKLDDLNLLDKIGIDSITKAYKSEG